MGLRPPSAGSGGHLGLYSRITAGTISAVFQISAWKLLNQTLPPVSQRGRVAIFKSDTKVLDTTQSTLGTQFIQPENIVRDNTDGSYYCTCTFSTLGGAITAGWLHCPAGADPRVGSNWVEAGLINGISVASGKVDAPHVFSLGPTYYALIGGKNTGEGVKLYKSTTGILGPYSLVVDPLLAVGAAGTWNVARVDEPCYLRRADGTHVIFAMGFNTGNANEQTGMWTCPSGSNIETPGNWTPAAGNPVIPASTGTPGSDDEQVKADPHCMEVDGTLWIGSYDVAANGVIVSSHHSEGLTTTTDLVTFTKRGAWLEDFALHSNHLPSDAADNSQRLGPNWRGHWYRLGPEYDNDVLWMYGANVGGFTSSNRRVGARLAVIPLECFRSVPVRQPWVRIQAEATDSRIVRQGTGWTSNANTGYQGGTAYFSTTAGDRFQFYTDDDCIGVRVRGQMRNSHGIADLYIDGTKVATVDLYQAGDVNGSLWSIYYIDRDDLPAGRHLVEVVVTGTKNAASSGTNVLVDYVEQLLGRGTI
jgi:hypothetical protein